MLAPFRALRYGPGQDLAAVTAPPYDVIDASEQQALESASEYNVVRLILPRAEPGGAQDRYQAAADRLWDWRAQGVLRPDAHAALYVYEQARPASAGAAPYVQRGLLGALALTPAQDGIVLPHENTMAGPVSDRLALYAAVEADLEPIFLLYDGGGAASRLVRSVGGPADGGSPGPGGAPLVDAVLGDGLRHRLWSVRDPAVLTEVAADLAGRRAVIADGHHRYATYLQRQADHHARGDGPGPWDHGLTFLVDDGDLGPQVHPIHRVVPGRSAEELATLAARIFTVRTLAAGGADAGGVPDAADVTVALAALAEAARHGPAFLLAAGDLSVLRLLEQPDKVALAAAMPPDRSSAWRALDVSILHQLLVRDLWSLQDTVEQVGFEHDVPAALAHARRTGGTAVLLTATPAADVVAVAAAGERMPRKSTLFTPKPRTGLVIRDHRDVAGG